MLNRVTEGIYPVVRNAVRRLICRVDSPQGNPPQLRMTAIDVVSLTRRLILLVISDSAGARPFTLI